MCAFAFKGLGGNNSAPSTSPKGDGLTGAISSAEDAADILFGKKIGNEGFKFSGKFFACGCLFFKYNADCTYANVSVDLQVRCKGRD